MEFTVYAIYSPAYDKIYIGYSSNLQTRIASHNEFGHKGWTIKYRPWTLIYTEIFSQKSEAMKREKELKSYQGRSFIRNFINKNIILKQG